MPLPDERRGLWTLLGGRRFELDHQFSGYPSAVFHLDALRPPWVGRREPPPTRRPRLMMFATTNPDAPSHWLRKKYLLRAGDIDLRHIDVVVKEDIQWPVADPRGRWHDR